MRYCRSDSSDEDMQKLKDSKLFVAVRKKLSEEKISEEIKKCLDDGAEMNAKNTRDKTVLDIAVKKGYEKLIKFLVKQKGIEITTALDLAKNLKKQGIVEILESYNQQIQNRALVLQSHDASEVKFVDNKNTISSKNTKGDGNCFFHAVFGDNKSGQYEAEKAKEMRNEWYNFLKQFESQGLKDSNIPHTIKEQLQKVFQFFLNNPQDLTNRSDAINRLVKQTQTDITTAEIKTSKLKNDIVQKFQDINEEFRTKIYKIISDARGKAGKHVVNIQELLNDRTILINEIDNNLEECALQFNPNLNHETYSIQYNTCVIANSFLENPEIYKNYLEAIKQDSYYVFFEEIPMLSSLANIKIQVYYNNGRQTMTFEPNQKLRARYPLKPEIWSNKGEAIIAHAGIHFSHAESENQLIDSPGQHTIPSKRQSTDNDQDGTPNKNIKSDTRKRPRDNETPNDNEDGVTPEKRFKDSSLPDGPYQASGVKSTLHGVVYQLKLLMLLALRGKTKGYAFRLATEMDEAEKFDDVVFRYMKPRGSTQYSRFLQAKHIQVYSEKSEKIKGQDLLTESDDKFSLQKYFLSYRKIKQKPTFQQGKLQDFTICTNIDFNFDSSSNGQNLKKLSYEKPLYFEPILEEDDMLNIGGERYRFVSKSTYPNQRQEVVSELTELFTKTSELKKLATALAKHLLAKQTIGLDNAIFKAYQDSLAWYVIDIRNQKLAKRFLDGNLDDQLFPGVKSFRTTLREAVEQHLQELEELKENHPEKLTERDKEILGNKNLHFKPPPKKLDGTSQGTDPFWSEMAELSLELSNGFKQVLTLDLDPQLTNIEGFTQEMVRLINQTKHSKKEIHVQQGKKKGNKILNPEITKLAGHVLIECNGAVGFSKGFLKNHLLAGNLNDFRIKLMAELKVKDNQAFRDKLKPYTFKITGFQTCQEAELPNLLNTKPSLPEEKISNDEVEAFLDQLVFAVNHPNEEKLSQLISNEIGAELNLIDANLITNDFQNTLLNWMKIKQGSNDYLSENGIDVFFKKAKEKIAQLVLIGPTSEYTKKIKEVGISFKFDTLPNELRIFLTPDLQTNSIKKSVFNFVTPPKATLLGSIKVNQVLREVEKYNTDGSYIFICLNSLLRLEKEVRKAFERKATRLLIVECKPQERSIDTLYNSLLKVLTRFKNKQLLLITPDGDSFFSALNNNDCAVYRDKPHFCFYDLDSESQNNFLDKKEVTFQGEKIILNELIDKKDENVKQIIDLETLIN